MCMKVLKLYEFIILISIQSECQEVVTRFMKLDEASQTVIQRVIQFYADDVNTHTHTLNIYYIASYSHSASFIDPNRRKTKAAAILEPILPLLGFRV